MTIARVKAARGWLLRLTVLAAALALAAGPASARDAEVTPPPSPTPVPGPAPDPAPTPAPKPAPKKKAPAAKPKPAAAPQVSTAPPASTPPPPSTRSTPPASPPPAHVSQPVPSTPKRVTKAKVTKPKATPKKRPAHTVRPGTPVVTRPAVPDAAPASATRGTVAGSSQLLPNVDNPSRTWQTTLAILLFGIPLLLMLAALVPLNFNFVPYRIADGWQDLRVGVAICGGSLLVVEAAIYLAST